MGADVQGVDDSGDVTEDGEEDVDEEVGAAAALEEDADGGEEDGEDDLADVAGWVLVGRVRRGFCFNCSSPRAGEFEAGGVVVPSSESHDEFVCGLTSLFERLEVFVWVVREVEK